MALRPMASISSWSGASNHALHWSRFGRLGCVLFLYAMLAYSLPARSQTPPDAGSIQRDLERQQPLRPPVVAPRAQPTPIEPPRAGELQFQISGFVLEGVTLVPSDEVQSALEPWVGRPIQFSDLDRAKQAIVDLYQRYGWFARPLVPEQELQDNSVIKLEVIEGRLGEVRIEHETPKPGQLQRIDRERIFKTFTARQQPGEPLYMPNVERAVSLLNDLPGSSVNATLATGEGPGATDLVVTPQLRALFSGTVSRDNTGSRSTGVVKDTLAMSLDSPYGWGDQASLNLMRSKGVEYARMAYSFPLGYDGLRFGFNASTMNYHVIFPMSESNPSYPRGSATTQGLNISWPVLKGPKNNLNLQASFDHKHFINEIFNPDNLSVNSLSNKQLGVGSFSLAGDHSDEWGEGGITQWNLGFSRGRVDLSANTQNSQQDQQGPRTDGLYNKLSLGLSRLQRITSTQSMWLSLQGQRADKNLDSSEKFTLGGSQGVRAYPSAEGAGDHGWLFTMEGRQVLSPQWQWLVLYDFGQVTTNHQNYVGFNGPTQVNLRGAGLSLSYSLPGQGQARLTWSRRVGDNPLANVKTGMDSDGSLITNRLWLTVSGFF